MVGHSIHHEAASVLEKLGGDPSNFAARQFKPRIAVGADLILTMTRAHRDSVLELVPHKLNRTFSLGEAATLIADFGAQTISELAAFRPRLGQGEVPDVLDPIGQGPEVFSAVGSQIADLLNPILALCQGRV